MYKIIVFTHGSLAESLVRTSRLILGNQPDIETYCVEPGCNCLLYTSRFAALDAWSMYLITSYEDAQKYIGRKADKNRKIYNGMLLSLIHI